MNTDKLTVRIVVYTLAVIAIGGFVVFAACALTHTTVPDALDRYSFGALTALMALLSKTSTNDEPTSVTVTNPPDAPVPVDTTPPTTGGDGGGAGSATVTAGGVGGLASLRYD